MRYIHIWRDIYLFIFFKYLLWLYFSFCFSLGFWMVLLEMGPSGLICFNYALLITWLMDFPWLGWVCCTGFSIRQHYEVSAKNNKKVHNYSRYCSAYWSNQVIEHFLSPSIFCYLKSSVFQCFRFEPVVR